MHQRPWGRCRVTWLQNNTAHIPALTYRKLLAYWQADRAALQRVRELHRPILLDLDERDICDCCCRTWPCPTIRALNGTDE